MDFFSLFPQDFIHTQILPRLPIKEAARTSILSKRFKSLWNSFPYLEFYQFDFHHTLSFKNFVDHTLRDPERNKTDICKFKLLLIRGIQASDIDNWIRLVMSKNVREFHIQILGEPYQWPSRNLCMANTITKLELHKVRFSSTNDTITMPHLQTLYFDNVWIDQETIENIFSGCPSMSDLNLWSCYDLKSLIVSKNPQLKRVCIGNCISLQTLGITHVTCLQSLTLSFTKSFETLSNRGFVLDSRAYDTLNELCLCNYSIKEYAFQVLLSSLTNLKCLVLKMVILCLQFIRISSKNLKILQLDHCDFLIVFITAPNLTSLKYENNLMLLYPMETRNIKDYIFTNSRNYTTGPYFKSLRFEPVKQFLMNSIHNLWKDTKMIINLKWCKCTLILEDWESIAQLPCKVIDGLFQKTICISNMSFFQMVEWFLNNSFQFCQKLLIISSTDDSKFYKVLKKKKPSSYSESPYFTMNREAFERNTGFSIDSMNYINAENINKFEFLDVLFGVGFNTKQAIVLERL